jgi:ATP-dependent Clp protease protease subunit
MFQVVEVDPLISRKPFLEFQNGCLDIPHVIRFMGDFTEDSAKDFVQQFTRAVNMRQPIIPIVIDSYGGEVMSLMHMISIIRTSPVPVATIMMGKAMSCGAILLSCGTKGYRYVSPDSTLLVHEISGGARGKTVDVLNRSEHMKRLNQRSMELLSTNCGQHKDFFANKIHENGHADLYFSPEESVAIGIADHVGTPTLKTKVIVQTTLELADTPYDLPKVTAKKLTRSPAKTTKKTK